MSLKTFLVFSYNTCHDDVIKWKHFPRYWPFVRGIHTQRPVMRSFDVFFQLRQNKRLCTQSWGWWFETLSRLLWRQCNVLWLLMIDLRRNSLSEFRTLIKNNINFLRSEITLQRHGLNGGTAKLPLQSGDGWDLLNVYAFCYEFYMSLSFDKNVQIWHMIRLRNATSH